MYLHYIVVCGCCIVAVFRICVLYTGRETFTKSPIPKRNSDSVRTLPLKRDRGSLASSVIGPIQEKQDMGGLLHPPSEGLHILLHAGDSYCLQNILSFL